MAISSTRMRGAAAVGRPDLDAIRGSLQTLQAGSSYCMDVPIHVDQFLELLPEEDQLELVNGIIYRPLAVTIAHEDLFGWLLVVVRQYVETRGLGRAFGSRTALRISRTTARMPDIAFVSTANLERLRRLEIAGAADLAIEIVESAKSRREAVGKQAQYEELGVPELWVIDLQRRQFRQFLLEDGRYRTVTVERDGDVYAQVIAGLRLTVAWFFQGPEFPNSLEVVTQLLDR